eukprot:6833463-Alexandrium_andersonii.AAC.1
MAALPTHSWQMERHPHNDDASSGSSEGDTTYTELADGAASAQRWVDISSGGALLHGGVSYECGRRSDDRVGAYCVGEFVLANASF